MQLSEKLQSLRKQANFSQEELAEKLGVSRQAVSKWESGAATPEVEKLVELSRIYRVSLNELLQVETFEEDTAGGERDFSEQQLKTLEELLARRRIPLWRRILPYGLIGLLAAAVLAGGMLLWGRFGALEDSMAALRGRVDGLNITQVPPVLPSEEPSLVSDYSFVVTKVSGKEGTVILRCRVVPKTVHQGLAVSLTASGDEFDTVSAPLTQEEGATGFAGEIVVPLNDRMTLYAVLDDGASRQTQLLEPVDDLRASLFLKVEAEYKGKLSRSSLDNLLYTDGTAEVTLTRTGFPSLKIQDGGDWGGAEPEAISVYLYRNGEELRRFDADLRNYPEEEDDGPSAVAEFGNATYMIPVSVPREEGVTCGDGDTVELVARVEDDRGNVYRCLLAKLGGGEGTGLERGKIALEAGE